VGCGSRHHQTPSPPWPNPARAASCATRSPPPIRDWRDWWRPCLSASRRRRPSRASSQRWVPPQLQQCWPPRAPSRLPTWRAASLASPMRWRRPSRAAAASCRRRPRCRSASACSTRSSRWAPQPQLAAMMAATAAKALNLLAERAEYSAASRAGAEAAGAAGGWSRSRRRRRRLPPPVPTPRSCATIALCSQLQETHRSLSTLLTRLPPTAAPALGRRAGCTVQATAVDAVAPIFRAVMVEACEERLLRMHGLARLPRRR
ncbi:hypothetical protein PLESTM_000761900, partial [Pleodorina starrii]